MNSQRTRGIVHFARDKSLEGNLFGSQIEVFCIASFYRFIQGSEPSGLLLAVQHRVGNEYRESPNSCTLPANSEGDGGKACV